MRSHLTRNVSRRLLVHQVGFSCPAIPVSSVVRPQLPQPRSIVRRPCRRTFFGLFQKPPREPKEVTPDPGYETLINFRSCEAQGHRLPPREELIQGFRTFFQHKLRYHQTVNSTQALLAVGLLRHLTTTDGELLSLQDLRTARDALLKPPKRTSEGHLELAKALYDQIRALSAGTSGPAQPKSQTDNQTVGGDASAEDFKAYLTSLTLYGGSVEAAAALEEYWKKLQETGSLYKGAKFLWVLVLRGLAKEGREEELLQLFKKGEKLGVEFMPALHEVMVTFFAGQDRVDETKQWFERPIYGNWLPLPETYLEVLRFAVRNSQQEWVNPIFEQLRASKPTKPLWDVIFQWAVLTQNAGPEDLKPLLDSATFRNQQQQEKPIKPDIATLNDLVSAAIEKKDPYLAERFISFGASLHIAPNSRTYLLQMDYRISASDLSGATAAYRSLQTQYIADDEDLPVVNRYLRALCAAPAPNTELVLDITQQLEQRGAALEPETVAALCVALLTLDRELEAVDALAVHATNLSLEERGQVESALVAYCLDRRRSTARVWDGYTLLRQFFPEAGGADRAALMDAFFARRRPDMAAHVFGHMRAAANPAQRPTRDTYVRVFEGLARCPDQESLRMVHNMLKMDTAVQPDTRLYNALMLAYLGCGEPEKAYEFWDEITRSREGPTYRSLEIVFRVCEGMAWGDRKARAIWDRMARMDLDVPGVVFSAYCGAIAGQGHVEEVRRLIKGMGEADVLTLGIAYNALPGSQLQEDFEEWAQREYPEIWARLLKKGRKKSRIDNISKFNIVREMKA